MKKTVGFIYFRPTTHPWEKYRFTVIDEGFGGSNNNLFTLYNTLGDGSVASITSGYTQVVSSLSNVNGVGNVVINTTTFPKYSNVTTITSAPPKTTLSIPSGYTKFILVFTGHANPYYYINKFTKYSPVLNISDTMDAYRLELADGMYLNVINPSNFKQATSITHISYTIVNNTIIFNSSRNVSGPNGSDGYTYNGELLASLWPYIPPIVSAIFFN